MEYLLAYILKLMLFGLLQFVSSSMMTQYVYCDKKPRRATCMNPQWITIQRYKSKRRHIYNIDKDIGTLRQIEIFDIDNIFSNNTL